MASIRTVYGVGYLGDGDYITKRNGKFTSEYVVWHGMLRRCYDEGSRAKHPTYVDCTVCDRWHDFQAFCRDTSRMANAFVPGFELDKDLRVLGNLIYRPEACSFVPKAVNALLNNRAAARGNLPQGVYLPTGYVNPRYAGCIREFGKLRQLGCFDTPEEAHAAYKVAKTAYVRQVALQHKSSLHKDVYRNLRNYKEM